MLVLEDVHWADPSTLDFIRGIVDRGGLAPLLLLITARPEFRPPWAIRSHHATISLAPLDRSQVREMVAELSARYALPKQIIDGVTERTGGVPLFIEEVTRLLLERGEQGGVQAIPPTLHQSLMARLDRLGPAREVAQIAAVIGRDFSYGLLRAVAGMDEVALQGALDRLAEADIFLVQGVPPQSEYRFKHALIQDAAYENLLKSRRQVLHRRVGEVFRDQFPAISAAQPELVAHHFGQAGLAESAIEWWGEAGRRSMERSALVEALAQLTRALNVIATLPPTPALRQEEIELQVALITPLIHLKGYSAPETKAASERARLLIEDAEAVGEPPKDSLLLFSAYYGLFGASTLTFNGNTVRELSAKVMALAEKERTAAALLLAHRIMGISSLYTGCFAEARTHMDSAIALYNPTEHRALATRFVTDVRAHVLCYRSLALWVLGYPAVAHAAAGRALSEARDVAQAGSLMNILALATTTYILSGDYAAASAGLDELIVLAGDKGSVYWKARGTWLSGWLSSLTGEPANAVELLTSGIATLQTTGATLLAPTQSSCLAAAHAQLGQSADARRCIDVAIAAIGKSKETWFEAEVNRIAGELTLVSPEHDATKAEAYFKQSLAIARQQQAKSWELRAAMSLARLWRSQGKMQEARELLAPVYGWFTEGFDTRDLKEAKSLLEQLS